MPEPYDPTQIELPFPDRSPLAVDRFQKFHEDNPRVYEVLVALAREWVARTGRHRIGIATLYERARWEIAMETSDADFKLNNDYRAWYARLIMLREPDLVDIFEVRKSAADGWVAA